MGPGPVGPEHEHKNENIENTIIWKHVVSEFWGDLDQSRIHSWSGIQVLPQQGFNNIRFRHFELCVLVLHSKVWSDIYGEQAMILDEQSSTVYEWLRF